MGFYVEASLSPMLIGDFLKATLQKSPSNKAKTIRKWEGPVLISSRFLNVLKGCGTLNYFFNTGPLFTASVGVE